MKSIFSFQVQTRMATGLSADARRQSPTQCIAMDAGLNSNRPITANGDLAKLPPALVSLAVRPQWCVWKWQQKPNGWQKPPFIATDPDRHASSTDPATWCKYATALATVEAKQAEGISYILTPDDPFAAADLDNCRDRASGVIAEWAQLWLDQAATLPTYAEITPSGRGLRIWGSSSSGEVLHGNMLLEDGGRIELFRRTNKILTVTGLQVGQCVSFGAIDALLQRATAWSKRHKAASATVKSNAGISSGTLSQFSIEQVDAIVRDGAPPESNRSDLFHAIVGHYSGCGWSDVQIIDHLEQYPDGIGSRYLAEGRLAQEVDRSLLKWQLQREQQFAASGWSTPWQERPASEPESELEPENPRPDLPPMFCHGDPDPRPITSWLVKNLLASVSFGILSGQWGTGKTFLVFELSACLMTGQPFIGCSIKRQCGVMYVAAEGISEVRRRLEAVIRCKCGGMARAPFRWYEAAPTLLGPDALEMLTAMAKQAEHSLQAEFGLPLGLIVIDTIAASAGYAQAGAENDAAVGARIMQVLQQVAQACNCMVLGVDHFGKNVEGGTRGTSSKEANAEVVLACLGEREVSGNVVNTRLAIRKNRGGPQGQEYPFTLRPVELGFDEDDEPITSMVVDWQTGPAAAAAPPPGDPWQQSRQADTRQAMLLLKRVLMSLLAQYGVDLPSGPNGPVVRMVDQEIVREEFYARTAAEGTPAQKQEYKRKRFNRARNRAEELQLIGIRETGYSVWLWLMPIQPAEGETF
jgi:hypothetical protein